jgi:hypothetical protein
MKMSKHFKCQSCEEEYDICIKTELTELKKKDSTYILCPNCLIELIGVCLTPKHFFNLLHNGHKVKEFYLHSDFYDELTGKAIQPKLKLEIK